MRGAAGALRAALGRVSVGRLHKAAAAVCSMSSHREVAVVGGGLAGAFAARMLAESVSVTLFDMGRAGFGGRNSTRQLGQHQFDHGCQFIHSTSPEVAKCVEELETQGVMQRWQGTFGTLHAETGDLSSSSSCCSEAGDFCGLLASDQAPWVGVPSAAAICTHLVTAVERLPGGGWRLTGVATNPEAAGQTFEHQADWLVLADMMTAVPGLPGSVDFGSAADLPLLQQLRRPRKVPVFSLMAVTDAPPAEAPFAGAVVQGSHVFQWLALDSSKPGRQRTDGRACWVAVTHPGYAEARLHDWQLNRAALEADLTAELQALLERAMGRPLPVVEARAQRWGSGFKADLLQEPYLLDAENQLAACGDFCLESSAEGAMLSGARAAKAILECIARQPAF